MIQHKMLSKIKSPARSSNDRSKARAINSNFALDELYSGKLDVNIALLAYLRKLEAARQHIAASLLSSGPPSRESLLIYQDSLREKYNDDEDLDDSWPRLNTLQLLGLLLTLVVCGFLYGYFRFTGAEAYHSYRFYKIARPKNGSCSNIFAACESVGPIESSKLGAAAVNIEQEAPKYTPDKKQPPSNTVNSLAERLTSMIQAHGWYRNQKSEDSCSELDQGNNKMLAKKPKDNNSIESKVTNDTQSNGAASPVEISPEATSSQCRSSRSYIKSLVDVLSRARNQIPQASRFLSQSNGYSSTIVNNHDEDDDEDDDDDNDNDNDNDNDDGQLLDPKNKSPINGSTKKFQNNKTNKVHEEAAMLGQMDISAAHLILNYMEKHLEDKERLKREWQQLNNHKKTEAKSGERNKNRVRLDKSPANCYLNASLIYDDNPRCPKHIIAQGPDEKGLSQFWQMVWEQGVSVIVTLNMMQDYSSKNCFVFWPRDSNHNENTSNDKQELISNNNQSSRRNSVTSVYSIRNGQAAAVVANTNCGPSSNMIQLQFEVNTKNNNNKQSTSASASNLSKFEVHLVSEHVSSSEHLVRNMYMINRTSGETRTISQFHYLAWPNNGVPENVRDFLHFRRKVNKCYRDPKSPVLVHCADGAGRSGTYTLIDIILERIKNGTKEIDPRATLEHLRDQRAGLCSTQKQFEFVMVALAEEIQLIIDSLPQ